MQGIEQLGYEVVEEPMVPQGGVQTVKGAADMLAEFGRNGDTYVVHAAEGETMIPMEILDANPRLKRMLFSQMQEMGIEPERYIVGNELNSINPVTGRPEFFFKGLFKGIGRILKKVVKVVKVLAPIVLPIVAPFLLPAMPLAFSVGLGSLAGNLISGKNIKQSLISAVVSGATAGVGSKLFGGVDGFGSGSFFGSKINPAATFGEASFKNAFTLDNPFTAAMAPNLQAAVNARSLDVSQAAAKQALKEAGQGIQPLTTGQPVQAAPPSAGTTPPVSMRTAYNALPPPGVAGMTPQTQQTPFPTSQPPSVLENIKRAVVPGDEYGLSDLYGDYLSPNRASIQPNSVEATLKGREAVAEANKALTAKGLVELTELEAGELSKQVTEQALAQAAPGMISRYAPLATTVLGGALASDAAFGTNIITPQKENPLEYDQSQDPINYAQALIDQNPGKYGIDANKFFGRGASGIVGLPEGGATGTAFGGTMGQGTATNPYLEALRRAQPQPQPQPQFQPQIFSGATAGRPTGAYGLNTIQSRNIFAAQGGEIVGPGTGTSDSIPAMLSDGEFVMTRKAVEGAGRNRQDGAQRMYDLMHEFEKRA